MAILPVGFAAEEGGYQIERSLRFNSADSAYLGKTFASAGNRKTWTWSGWVKRSKLASAMSLFGTRGASPGDVNTLQFGFTSSDTFEIGLETAYALISTPVYRDPSSFYHVVVALDTTQSTASNRLRVYINGTEVTTWSTDSRSTLISQNSDLGINIGSQLHQLGSLISNSWYFDGYMTEVHFVDGSQLTPSSFGETDTDTGVWKPKAYSGSYGTNGFYLDFGDNSSTTALGYDAAGSNDWTPNNFSVTAGAGNDSLVDSPTRYGTDTGVGGEVRGNYCTMNGVDSTNITLSNGNLTGTQATSWQGNTGTFLMTSGKWYWEITADDVYNTGLGVIIPNSALHNQMRTANSGWVGAADGGFGIIYNGSGSSAIWYSNYYTSYSISNYLTSASNGDILQVAFDADSGKIWIGKNNTWGNNGSGAGNPANGTNPGDTLTATELSRGLLPFFSYESGQLTLNAGQRPFAYTAPSGFKALCTQNLPTPTIGATSTTQANDYFNPVLYTGNGTSLSVTGVGFQPDLVWIKSRSDALKHKLTNSVVGVQKALSSDNTDAESTDTGGLTAFNSDGFTIGSTLAYNTNAATYVAWNWKANGAGSSNTAGTITSTVSANTTAGFSIVTYTGTGSNATVGHGLGVAPAMIIVKNRGTTTDWAVYHKSLTSAAYWLELNTNGTQSGPNSVVFNSTAPTSTVFSVGTNDRTNATNSYVAYCFSEVPGYSSMGSFVGNGNADGPFIHLGFRARWIMVKEATTSSRDWIILDTARNTYNVADLQLMPNKSDAEATTVLSSTAYLDILSNGFKVRNSSVRNNENGATYIYAAFAENPFKFSLAR
jgi:hypothetical protein